jgi:hypothetical protein
MLTTKNFLEECVLEWGIPASKINKIYKDSLYEAKHLGQELNIEFIKEIMSTILDRKETLFVDQFIKSKKYDLKEFLESLYDEEIIEVLEDIVSTDFSPNQRPENAGHKMSVTGLDIDVSDDEQEENNKKADI